MPTNCTKAKIQHVSNSKSHLCSKRDKTIDHLISGFNKISRTKQHDRAAIIIHWKLCQKFAFECNKNLWNHQAEKILEKLQNIATCSFKLNVYGKRNLLYQS